jgi:hypothetical protein
VITNIALLCCSHAAYCVILLNDTDIDITLYMYLSISMIDPLVNLVLDECKETLRDVNDPYKLTGETRFLGLLVARGTSVMLLSPIDGMQEISNPFIQQQQQDAQQV